MIISRTPLRISFMGGGSDLSSFYRISPGAVVTTAINKYIYITVNKKFDNKIRASYSQTEIVDNVNVLQHELIRECMRLVGINGGIEITSISDIPSEGTGLGSSSSYVVGLLNALYAYIGKHVAAKKLAEEACQIEIDILKKPIGKQDQYIAAFGGLQYIQFNSDETVFVDPIICKVQTKRDLQNQLLLFYTGITRSSTRILSKQFRNMKYEQKKVKVMQGMVHLAEETRDALNSNDLTVFGRFLHKNWTLKKKMVDEISSEKIDTWYERARKAGAIGGKILGAGGGGFLLFFAPKGKHENVIKANPDLIPITYNFEPQGSKIIYVTE